MGCLRDAGLEPKIYIHAGAIIEVLASQYVYVYVYVRATAVEVTMSERGPGP